MATTKLIPAPVSAEHAGTAPLPPAAVSALERLEAVALPSGPSAMAAAYRKAAQRVESLSTLALLDRLSDLDADSLAHAEELMAGARATLAAAGRLDLIEAAA